jgi:hypothetical protein
MTLPDVYFGKYGRSTKDWRSALVNQEDPDDELLYETPADVVGMLGFDPAETDSDDEIEKAEKPKCPHCGSGEYGLMPPDFETAKCKDCGRNWNHGIVDGINNPMDKGDLPGHEFRGNQYTDVVDGGEPGERPAWLPRRLTMEWLHQRLAYHQRMVAMDADQKPLVAPGESVHISRDMDPEEAKAQWERYRAAATAFRNEGNILEWRRHYGIGRRFFKVWQKANGGAAAAEEPESEATPELTTEYDPMNDPSLRASFDELKRQGKMDSRIPVDSGAWNNLVKADPGTFFNSIFKDSGLGYSIRSVSAGSSDISFRIALLDKDGNNVGHINRSITFESRFGANETVAYHSSFSIDAATGNKMRDEGKSIGKSLLGNSMYWYKKLGVKRIEVGANCNVGGYAWAKYGFVPSQHDWDRLRNAAMLVVSPRNPDAVFNILRDPNPKAMWAFSDTIAGKDFLLGESWSGVLRLDHPDELLRYETYTAKGKGSKK